MTDNFCLHDKVIMKKPHPCGANEWEITYLGSDIGLKCLNCNRVIMIPRVSFIKSARKIIKAAGDAK